MSFMFEVYSKPPVDQAREEALNEQVSRLGGRLDFREVPESYENMGICLTYEFRDLEQAEEAAEFLRHRGEHVEGPVSYGP
jgi:hypothetical protein